MAGYKVTAPWEDPEPQVGFADDSVVQEPYKRTAAYWEYASKDSAELLEDEKQRQMAANYKYKEPWNLSETSSAIEKRFERELENMDYNLTAPWTDTSGVLRDLEKKNEEAAKYNYKPMWEPQALTEKQIRMMQSYKMKTPYEREDGVEPPAAPLTKKTSASSRTIAPWAHGTEPAPKNNYKRKEQPQTVLWDNLEKPAMQELAESSGDPVLDGFRAQLKTRGAPGILGLAKKFKIMDDDCSGTLDMAEFTKGMRELALPDLTDMKIKHLFRFFDSDDSGTIDYDEFLLGVRGTMSRRRMNMVEQAFAQLDKDGSGVVDFSDVMDTYSATSHPDFISGRRTEKQILEDFLSNFVVPRKRGQVLGGITRKDFYDYYNNISSSIDNDDYFELMIRNAWHISGGEGWAANTSNRRVLVTKIDGTEAVEEIRNDLGLGGKDKAGMVARLRAQGVHAASVSFDGATEEKKGVARDMSDADIEYFKTLAHQPRRGSTGEALSAAPKLATYTPLQLQRFMKTPEVQAAAPRKTQTLGQAALASIMADKPAPLSASAPAALQRRKY